MAHGKFGVAAVAYVLLFGVCAILDDLRPAFLVIAVTSIAFILTGIILLPRTRIVFQVLIPKAEQDHPAYVIRVAGTEIHFRSYFQLARCTLSLRHIPELAACGILAIASVFVLMSRAASYQMLLVNWGLFALEGAVFAGAIVLFVCLRWAEECVSLRGAQAALAAITGISSSLEHRQFRYEFFDNKGNRFGGYARVLGRPEGNAVIAFYDPSNPDNHRVDGSFNFRQLRIDQVAALPVGR